LGLHQPPRSPSTFLPITPAISVTTTFLLRRSVAPAAANPAPAHWQPPPHPPPPLSPSPLPPSRSLLQAAPRPLRSLPRPLPLLHLVETLAVMAMLEVARSVLVGPWATTRPSRTLSPPRFLPSTLGVLGNPPLRTPSVWNSLPCSGVPNKSATLLTLSSLVTPIGL
jgi:hypothetical protein